MEVGYGVEGDISSWMSLVSRVRYNFPGLETEEGLKEYRETTLKFMGKKQALCVKDGGFNFS